MKKQVYNFEYLTHFCKENNIELLKDFSKEKVTRDTCIEGNCKSDNCNDTFTKNFRQLTISNAFCKSVLNIIDNIKLN
jgi:hypothetical protein